MIDFSEVKNISISKQGEGWKVSVEYEFNKLSDVIDFILETDWDLMDDDTVDDLDKSLTNKEAKETGGMK